MRVLLWFTIGFGAVCAAAAYGGGGLLLLPAVLAAVLLVLRGKRTAAAMMTGCLLGGLWFGGYRTWYLRPLEALEENVTLTITASDYGYDTGYSTGVDGVTILQGRPYRLRAYLDEKTQIHPGDSIHGTFRLRRLLGDDASASYYQAQGVYLFAYGEAAAVTRATQIPFWCRPAVLRQSILHTLEVLFPADTAPFARALLLGDRRDLDYETATALKLSGILHIVAVSGMHISLLYCVIAAMTMRRRFLTAMVGIPLLLVFSAVAGLTPSVLRAAIMVCLMMLATVFDREYDAPTALAFAVLVMLLANPMAVTSVSLQLSAGCVAGILLFRQPFGDWTKRKLPDTRIAGKLSGGISMTISAMSLVTPLCAWYFGSVSLVGVVTNLLTLWVTTAVFNGIIVTCLVWLLSPGLAGMLAGLLSWPIRYVLGVAEFLVSLPLAAVYTKSIYITAWLMFIYVLFAVFLTLGRKYPGKLLSLGVLGLCLALLLSWNQAEAAITMLDVGQGQCLILQSEGKTFLVDCGGDSDEAAADLAAETLMSRGITRLDGVVVTHYDRDHAGAVHHLLSRLETDFLFLPDTRTDWTPPAISGETVYVRENLELTTGRTGLRIYGPIYAGQDNENSLCVLFDTEKCDILITGDRTGFGERMLLRRNELPDVDILVAGHHGDREAVTEELLRQTKPEAVLISVGQDNFYGHPAPELLERLDAHGCAVYRTDLQGTITIWR